MTTTKRKFWRDVLSIHPAAELFPLMFPDELRELGEDIKKNGLTSPIVLWSSRDTPREKDFVLLDGRNRLDAMEAVGLKLVGADGKMQWDGVGIAGQRRFERGTDPYACVISANIHRRHLTSDQKRDLIAKLIKAAPIKSDRQIAETAKASPTTVGAVRTKMEAKGDVSKLDTRRDNKGRQQPAHKTTSTKSPPGPADNKPNRDDVGPNSTGEVVRKGARIEELENDKRRLEIKIVGLESEVEEARATNSDSDPVLKDVADEDQDRMAIVCIADIRAGSVRRLRHSMVSTVPHSSARCAGCCTKLRGARSKRRRPPMMVSTFPIACGGPRHDGRMTKHPKGPAPPDPGVIPAGIPDRAMRAVLERGPAPEDKEKTRASQEFCRQFREGQKVLARVEDEGVRRKRIRGEAAA